MVNTVKLTYFYNFPVWLDLSNCLVSRTVVIAGHLNISHIVSGDGAAPCNFPCLLLHGFAGLVVVDATVRSMCCFPDKEFHMRKPLGVHFTSVAVLGQDMVVDDQPRQHINAHPHSIQTCKAMLLPCAIKADRDVQTVLLGNSEGLLFAYSIFHRISCLSFTLFLIRQS